MIFTLCFVNALLYWWICMCWTILVPLEWTLLDHNILFLMCCFIDLLVFCLGFLHLYSSEILVCRGVCVGGWVCYPCQILISGLLGLIKCIRKYCLFKFLEEFDWKDGYQILFECWVEFMNETIWSWTFTFGEGLMVVSIPSLLICQFGLS